MLTAKADVLTGGDVFFDMVTVGATVNVMLAAAKAKGNTTIYNACSTCTEAPTRSSRTRLRPVP